MFTCGREDFGRARFPTNTYGYCITLNHSCTFHPYSHIIFGVVESWRMLPEYQLVYLTGVS